MKSVKMFMNCNEFPMMEEHEHSYKFRQWDALFLNFILVKKSYMFRTDLLSTIRSLNTVFSAIGICHTSYVDCLLARSETCRLLYQNKVEKQCISLVFIRIYHDARFSEGQKRTWTARSGFLNHVRILYC
jgi:hypothetical protein